MITRIRSIGVDCADQDRAIEFFGRLGFEKRREEPMSPEARWIELAPPGSETVLVPFQAGIVLECDDLDATYEELAGRGVEFSVEPTTAEWGRHAVLKDPEGNEYVLVPVGT